MAGLYASSSAASCSARCVAQISVHNLYGNSSRRKFAAVHSYHRDGTVLALHQPSTIPRVVKSAYLGERLGIRLLYIRGEQSSF